MNYKIFIISIARNEKRYTDLLNKLEEEGFDKNDIEVFIGIDYKKEKNRINLIKSKYGIITPKSVLSCAASHVLLWKHISSLTNKLDYAIILEDDSILNKEKFDFYRNNLENKINDSTFLNLSTSCRFAPWNDQESDLFVKSEIILAMDTYILTPHLCHKLYNFFYKEGLSYHIDFHLTFIKNQIPMQLLHFNRKITQGLNRLESSMVSQHDKRFVLKYLKDFEIYKELNTPIVEVNELTINAYIIFILIIFIILISCCNIFIVNIDTLSTVQLLFLCLLWFLFGCCLYDCI